MGIWSPGQKRRRRATFDRASLNADPDAYLAESESRFADIRPGLEKQIVWNDPLTKTKTPFSLIYLHGFSASSGELRPVPDLVAARLGANLFFTRLAGHGQTGEALGKATVEAWLDDTAEAIAIGERIGQRVIVMATSTGAALATWALAEPDLSKNISAAIFFSPNYGLSARGAFLLGGPFARQIAHAVIGPTRSFEPANALHAKLWTQEYPTDALLPMARTIALANSARLERIRVPALFFHSPQDKTVKSANIIRNARRWGAPHRLVAVENSGDPSAHVLAGDALSPSTTETVVDQIIDWLRDIVDPAIP
jgi:pimeloyl-ACP methyl ester carboxylesterase